MYFRMRILKKKTTRTVCSQGKMCVIRKDFKHNYLDQRASIQYTYMMHICMFDLLRFTIAILLKLPSWTRIAGLGNLRHADIPYNRAHLENAGSLWGTLSPAPCSVICYQRGYFIQR